MAFKIGPVFHLIHMADDFWKLNNWYADVFDPIEFSAPMRSSLPPGPFPSYTVEWRDASLITFADVCFEPMSPTFMYEKWAEWPVGKFYSKFGQHWHSIAWFTEDQADLYTSLREAGVRLFGQGGSNESDAVVTADTVLFTHPKDTAGALELMQGPRLDGPMIDPRFTPGYDPDRWAREHPLGLKRLGYVTLVMDDLEKGKHVYADTLKGTVLLENDSPLTMTKNVYVQVGDHTVVELAQPLEADSLAGRDLARNGSIMHAVTFEVNDVDEAEKYLRSKGITVSARDDTTLLCDPETTFGAPFRFTTTSLRGA
jgi:hypothetical protein